MKECILPPTTQRVSQNTNEAVNTQIRNKTIGCLNTYKDSAEPILSDKIRKLNEEWDTERILETTAASMILKASVMGYGKSKSCCFLMTGVVGFFLLQHALLGWCPPLSLMRMLGARTAEEINNEKTVLKMIRGDFAQAGESSDVNEMLAMAEKQ